MTLLPSLRYICAAPECRQPAHRGHAVCWKHLVIECFLAAGLVFIVTLAFITLVAGCTR